MLMGTEPHYGTNFRKTLRNGFLEAFNFHVNDLLYIRRNLDNHEL